MKLPGPRSIDVDGLRQVESQMQPLAAQAALAIGPIMPGWGWVILAFEFGGGGLSYVASTRDRAELARVVHRHSARLLEHPDGMVFSVDAEPEVEPEQLSREQVTDLAVAIGGLSGLISIMLPPGWGFAFLTWSPISDQAAYTSTAERGDMGLALREFSERIKMGQDRPPGVLGREN